MKQDLLDSGLILILTGGLSRRIGSPKALLTLSSEDSTNFFQAIVKRTSGLGVQVAAVTSPQFRGTSFGLPTVEQSRPEEGQMSSLLLGWAAFGEDAHWVMVALVDHPYVGETTYRQLTEARRRHPDALLWTPCYEGRSGHPVIFSAAFMRELKDFPLEHGARPLVQKHAARRRRVEVEDPAILWDVDTLDDYQRAQELQAKDLQGSRRVASSSKDETT